MYQNRDPIGANMAFRRAVFDGVGLFNKLVFGEILIGSEKAYCLK